MSGPLARAVDTLTIRILIRLQRQKLASYHPKLASGTGQQRIPGARDVSSPIRSAQARPSDGAPQP